ncbi:MAG: PAS domain S-box protein [Planctomycetota bacterium]
MNKPHAPRDRQWHPSRQEYHLWLRGQLDGSRQQVLEDHLRSCEACAVALPQDRLEEDPFVANLRSLLACADKPTNDESVTSEACLSMADSAEITTDQFVARKRWHPELLIGTGGVGEVWIAVDTKLNRTVALKKLRRETAHIESAQRRFLNEARITARLNHPGIVSVFDLVEDGSHSFYVMTLVRGQSLKSRLTQYHRQVQSNQGGRERELLALLRHWIAVARTIAFAHSQYVLHRDLKSENIVVGQFGQVTVLDWGLAKPMEGFAHGAKQGDDSAASPTNKDRSAGSITLQGARIGTPSFMAPEQAEGRSGDVDPRTDVWGLAAVLYEILTGVAPFVGSNADDVMDAVIHQPVVAPLDLVPDLPTALNEICMGGLRKERHRRFQTAAEFADQLESWMATQTSRRIADTARQSLFEMSDDLMMVFDHRPAVLWANSAWQRSLGWDPNALVGQRPNAMVHPDDTADDDEVFEVLYRGETASGMKRRTLSHDGQYRWHSWTATPILEEGIVCTIGRDIDAEIKRQREYESLLNAFPEAMVVMSREQTIRFVNVQLTELFGHEASALIDQSVSVLWPERLRAAYAARFMRYIRERAVSARDGNHRFFGVRKDGERFPLTIRFSTTQVDEEWLTVATIRRIE